jgi:hypothetical protein
MSAVEEIKLAIERLSLSDRGKLERWLHGWADDAWDEQIASDAASGRLDSLLSKVDAQIDSGKLRELP